MVPETFARALGIMQVHFRQEIAPETKATWWAAVSDLPDEAFVRACNRAMREEEHFPLPGTLRRFADDTASSVTPYHQRALPSPSERSAMRLHVEREREARTKNGEPALIAAWEARVAAARERWADARPA